MVDINEVTERILAQRQLVPPSRSLLVGISGIDGSGKGYVTRQLEARITQNSIATANINVDGWLNLPDRRFSTIDSGTHFYENAIRFDELFSKLLLPLRDHRSVEVVADFAEETASRYRKHTYSFKNVAVVLVEGIFLFKREHLQHFDLTIWVDCSFSTALARALERKQEGLPPAATIRAYDGIYFPAQKAHMDRDHPRESADLLINKRPVSRMLIHLANACPRALISSGLRVV
jgi:uridine kinase